MNPRLCHQIPTVGVGSLGLVRTEKRMTWLINGTRLLGRACVLPRILIEINISLTRGRKDSSYRVSLWLEWVPYVSMPYEDKFPCMGFNGTWKGFRSDGSSDDEKELLPKEPNNEKGFEPIGMPEDWNPPFIWTPHLTKGLAPEKVWEGRKGPLLIKLSDRGICPRPIGHLTKDLKNSPHLY